MPVDESAPNPSPDSESLVKRLAGPSTTKAGLAKDQSEINRIIAEASKGSKFYENEKRKDKDLTERIARILKYRDDAVKSVDFRSVERGVDQLLVKLEAQRDLTQIIVHVDMDAFYASVELLDNPSLKGTAFAVGKGVLTTASYEARKFGVRSGMPSFIAQKLCPNLILVHNHFQRYMEMSRQVMDIFRMYDPNMCAAGCDEGYLNITAHCKDHQLAPDECVRQIRDEVCRVTKLTVSAGIAPNRMLAKICSDKNKPNGQFMLEFKPAAIRTFMRDLSIRKLLGVGRVNERLLDSIGIKTCGDIYTHRAVLSLMDKQFGLQFLLQAYLGIASNVVQPGQREERKSIGSERTFSPLSDRYQILSKLEDIATELESDLESGSWTGKTVTLKYKLDTYQVFTRAKSYDRWISTKKEDLYSIGKELLVPELPLTLRLIGLRVTKLKDLRAERDQKARGIERFFGATNATASPRKRRHVDIEGGGDEPTVFAHFEDAMPGFHEHADWEDESRVLEPPTGGKDVHAVNASEEEVLRLPVKDEHSVQTQSRPPNSAPAPLTHSVSVTRLKPVSHEVDESQHVLRPAAPPPGQGNPARPKSASSCSSESPVTEPADSLDTLTCPVCSKSMQTDNQGLNAHIDFCLSKAAIREAQASASYPLSSPRIAIKPKSAPSSGSKGSQQVVKKRRRQ